MTRIQRIQQKVSHHAADAAWLTFLPDVRWATGFTGSNGLLLVRKDTAFFVTDRRYETQATDEVRDAHVYTPGYDLAGYVREEHWLPSGARVLFQSDHLPVAALAALEEAFPRIHWVPVEGLLIDDVARKEPAEIEAIRAAQRITDEVFEEILPLIRPGVTELELAAEITYRHLKRGAQKMSFDPIVAAGSNSALPHARPTFRALRTGDVVVMDFGCVLDGYASDMTRTVVLGTPTDHQRTVYDTVLRAQEAAISAARAGLSAKALDAVARDVIEGAGMGRYFGHGLGHGIGLQTHERPRVSHNSSDDLPVGAAVTIEPGVYMPGQFGVRIEDIVVLKENGCENLTTARKDLIAL